MMEKGVLSLRLGFGGWGPRQRVRGGGARVSLVFWFFSVIVVYTEYSSREFASLRVVVGIVELVQVKFVNAENDKGRWTESCSRHNSDVLCICKRPGGDYY